MVCFDKSHGSNLKKSIMLLHKVSLFSYSLAILQKKIRVYQVACNCMLKDGRFKSSKLANIPVLSIIIWSYLKKIFLVQPTRRFHFMLCHFVYYSIVCVGVFFFKYVIYFTNFPFSGKNCISYSIFRKNSGVIKIF